jgi:hypothetical protein
MRKRFCLLNALAFTLLMPALGLAEEAFSEKAYDIHLTENRLCKQCRWRWRDPETVELINPAGEHGRYPRREILGIDNHPIMRRLVFKSLHGIGLPGRIIAPQAFDDEDNKLRY